MWVRPLPGPASIEEPRDRAKTPPVLARTFWHGPRIRLLAGGDPVSICGVITTRDVLRHSAIIVREFGAAAYLKCCLAILLRRQTTFLACVCNVTRAG